jgi:hypothetical protein
VKIKNSVAVRMAHTIGQEITGKITSFSDTTLNFNVISLFYDLTYYELTFRLGFSSTGAETAKSVGAWSGGRPTSAQ